MTIAPSLPLIHGYEGANPYEIIPSKWGNLPRWHVNANLTGEMKGYERVRNDAINAQSRLDDLAAREKALMADKMAFSAEKAKFKADAEAFGAGASALMGRIAVEQDRLQKIKADQQEPLASPPGAENKDPEPVLELEGDSISGASPGEPTEPEPKEDQEGDPHGEFPRLTKPIAMDQPEFPDPELPHPPEVQQPIGVGLDAKDK